MLRIPLISAVIFLLALGVSIGVVSSVVWVLARRSAHKRSPLKGHLLRPPGYSLTKRLEELNEKINDWLVALPMAAMGIAWTYAIGGLSTAPGSNPILTYILPVLVFCGVVGTAAFKLR
jgi:hypothetical protein